MTIRFMSRGEIAEYLGVSLGTVKQYANFPPPDVTVGRNQGWAQATIDGWVSGRRRPKVLNVETAPPCVHCGDRYDEHKRPDAPADVAVYMPCTVCGCTGYADSDSV